MTDKNQVNKRHDFNESMPVFLGFGYLLQACSDEQQKENLTGKYFTTILNTHISHLCNFTQRRHQYPLIINVCHWSCVESLTNAQSSTSQHTASCTYALQVSLHKKNLVTTAALLWSLSQLQSFSKFACCINRRACCCRRQIFSLVLTYFSRRISSTLGLCKSQHSK